MLTTSKDESKLRMLLIDAIIQLQSGYVESYTTIMAVEAFGENSREMMIYRSVLDQMLVNDQEQAGWFKSYLARHERTATC